MRRDDNETFDNYTKEYPDKGHKYKIVREDFI